MGKVEKKSFIALSGNEDTAGSCLSKVYPILGGFVEEFFSNGSRVGLLTRIRVCVGRACTPLF